MKARGTTLMMGFLVALVCVRAEPAFVHETSDLRSDPAVRFGQLTNGLRYAIRANAEPKGRASLRFCVRAGSLHEADDQRGLAHFLEHMAFNGSEHFPAGTLVSYFQRLGMSFGGDTNATTSFDRTVYLLELPDTSPATLDTGFRLFADYGGGMLLAPEEIDRERGIILSEERARDSVGLRSLKAEFRFLLPETILADRFPIGSKEIIATAPRQRFADFYDAWYRPENCFVVAVGDFDIGDVEARLHAALGGLQARGPARPKPSIGTVRPMPSLVARLHSDPDAPSVTVSVQTVAPLVVMPNSQVRRLERLPRILAATMLNRRLSILAKEEKAPLTAGEAQVAERFKLFRAVSLELTCQPDEWPKALAVAEQELRRALLHGFQPGELKEAVAGLRRQLEQAVRTASTRPSREIAGTLVTAWIEDEVFTTPADDLALFGAALDRVTVEDCAAAWRELWPEQSGRGLFVSGNLTLSEPEVEIAAAYVASQRVAVAAPQPKEKLEFAYTEFGPEGRVVRKEEVSDLGITLIEFANGVRLNLKPTAFETGMVRVGVRVGSGRLTEPKDQPGLGRTAAGVFISGGLGRHSMDDINRIFAGQAVTISFGVDDDACVLDGTTTRDDLALQLQLFCAYLTDPGYRPEGLWQFHKGMEQTYHRLAHSVEGPFSTEVPALLAGRDSRFGLPDKVTLFARTAEEVSAWLTPQLSQGPLEIALVGDFEPDAAIREAARTVGALPARLAKDAYGEQRRLPKLTEPLQRDFRVPTESERGVVQLLWPATDRREVKLARRLSLLATVFQDRLRLKLREEIAGTYSPNVAASLSDTFVGQGFLVAEAAVEPGQAEVIAAAIRQVAAELAASGVTEEELQRAKQPLLVSLRTSERQNSYWLNNVLSAAQEQPQRLDWTRSRCADNESITAEELSDLAKRYLNPASASQFISRPERSRPSSPRVTSRGRRRPQRSQRGNSISRSEDTFFGHSCVCVRRRRDVMSRRRPHVLADPL